MLWVIDDDVILFFMEMFYKYVIINKLVCQVLQYSMIILQGKEYLKRIFNWVLFYVIGEDVKFIFMEIQQMKEKVFNFLVQKFLKQICGVDFCCIVEYCCIVVNNKYCIDCCVMLYINSMCVSK